MTFRSNKRRGIILLVIALVILVTAVFLIYRANLGDMLSRSRQLVAVANLWGPFKAGQQVKVMSGYSTSVFLQSLAAGEQVKDVLFCNLKPDGSPAYNPSAYKATMDRNAKCLSGYMEATKLREQSGVIQGNLGIVESMLSALSITGKELASAADYGVNVTVIPSGTFLPTPVQYASNIQMKCVVNADGGKSPGGIGTVQNLNASEFKIATPASLARFKALEKKIADLVKVAQDMMANGISTKAIWIIATRIIGLQSEMLAASIPLSPTAVQKYYRSILASGPTGNIGIGINRDENNMKTNCDKSVHWSIKEIFSAPYYRGSIGIASLAETVGFADVCLPTTFIANKVKESVAAQSQRFFQMRTSLGQQLKANTDALKKLEDNSYNCGDVSEKPEK